MTGDPRIEQAAASAFTVIRAKARAQYGANTGALLTVYAVESFLRRLALSPYARNMVLKGGMLMAANNIRAMTKDADLATHGLDNDGASIAAIVEQIAALEPTPHDGILIDPATIRIETMRQDAEYEGIRCKLVAQLGRAKVPFALDFSFGEPGRSMPIELGSVIGQSPVRLNAYPLVLNLAEKIVTAMQRRQTSTRDRDFADLWVTSRLHSVSAPELRHHIDDVARHRQQPLITLADALAAMPDRQQPYRAMVDRMSYLHPLPEQFADLIADVIEFIDPLLTSADRALTRWNHDELRWD